MTPTPIGALLGKHWSIICNPKKGDASIKCQTTTQVGQRAGWDKKTHDAFSCPNSAFLDKQGSWAGGSWAEKTCSLSSAFLRGHTGTERELRAQRGEVQGRFRSSGRRRQHALLQPILVQRWLAIRSDALIAGCRTAANGVGAALTQFGSLCTSGACGSKRAICGAGLS